jgi:hypothetical protein
LGLYVQISDFETGFSGPSEATMLGHDGAAPGHHATVSAKKVRCVAELGNWVKVAHFVRAYASVRHHRQCADVCFEG